MSTLTHTVKFNKEVTFTDHTGVSFVKNPVPGQILEYSPDINFNVDVAPLTDDTQTSWGCASTATSIVSGKALIGGDPTYFRPIYVTQANSGLTDGTEVTVNIYVDDINGSSLEVYVDDNTLSQTINTNGLTTFQATISGTGRFAVYNVGLLDSVVIVDSCSISSVVPPTQDEIAEGANVTSSTVSPADVIEYSVTWVTDPVAGDVVEWRYTPGTYTDADISEIVVSLEDTFSTDGTLGGMIADTGQTWTADAAFTVSGNVVACSTANAYASIDAGESFNTIYCDMQVIQSSGDEDVHLMLYFNGPGDQMRVTFRATAVSRSLRIARYVSGAPQNEVATNTTVDFQSGPKTVCVRIEGSNITAFMLDEPINTAVYASALPTINNIIGFRAGVLAPGGDGFWANLKTENVDYALLDADELALINCKDDLRNLNNYPSLRSFFNFEESGGNGTIIEDLKGTVFGLTVSTSFPQVFEDGAFRSVDDNFEGTGDTFAITSTQVPDYLMEIPDGVSLVLEWDGYIDTAIYDPGVEYFEIGSSTGATASQGWAFYDSAGSARFRACGLNGRVDGPPLFALNDPDFFDKRTHFVVIWRRDANTTGTLQVFVNGVERSAPVSMGGDPGSLASTVSAGSRVTVGKRNGSSSTFGGLHYNLKQYQFTTLPDNLPAMALDMFNNRDWVAPSLLGVE